jgi:hypothetical protein
VYEYLFPTGKRYTSYAAALRCTGPARTAQKTPLPIFLPLLHWFFLDFPICLQSEYIHLNTICKWCVGKRGRVEECSVAPLRDKRVKTLCGCLEKRVQTKEKYKLRLQLKLTN